MSPRDRSGTPKEPFFKDEHITSWLTARKAVVIFVAACMLAVLAFTASGLFLLHEVDSINKARKVGAADRHALHREIDTAVCTILDSYFPPVHPDPLVGLRKTHHCASAGA